MKKIIIFCMILALFLTGCGQAADIPEPNDTTPSIDNKAEPENTENTEIATDPAPINMPMVTVSVPVMTEEVTADDGVVIYRHTQQSMRLVMPDQDIAQRIIVDFLTRIDKVSASSEGILQQAQASYTGASNWFPYLCSISYAPTRIDQSVLSLYGSNVQYSGGVHATHTSCAANYNVLTGDVLTLGSIVVDESSVAKICELVIAELQRVKDEKYLRDGFEEAVYQRFAGEESFDENWYFSTSGLCFYFDQYAIAPYSSGVIIAEIPYSDLVGIIDDAFFPPELETTTGTIKTVSAQEADMSSFTRISELVLKAEAPMYVIHAAGTVQNVRIEWIDAQLGSAYTVFAAQSLGTGDAIVVQADPSLFSVLNISYESGGEETTVPLLP